MDSRLKSTPRIFTVGDVEIKDYGKLTLAPGEMVTVVSEAGKECDITAAEWGFYLGSSLNGRLKDQGFRAALVQNPDGKIFLNAVDHSRVNVFNEYLKSQGSIVVRWFD